MSLPLPVSPTSALTVRWILGPEALRAVTPMAEDLLERLPPEFYFHRPAWISALQGAWVDRGDRAGEPHHAFLLAEQFGCPVGLAPLQLERKGLLHLGLRRLHWIGTTGRSLSVPFADFLIPDPAVRRPCLTAMREFLLNQRAVRWDWLDLQMIPDHSESVPILDEIWPPAVARSEGFEAAILDPPDPAAPDFTGHLARKLLSDLRRRRRRLAGRGRLVFHDSATLPASVLSQMETIHRARQSMLRQAGHQRESLFDAPAQREGLLKALETPAGGGSARHAWLELDGRVIAFNLGVIWRGTYFHLLMAFDPEFSADSPSKLLGLDVLERASDWGVHRFHFLWGVNRFKTDFANRFHGYQFRRYVHPRWTSRCCTRWDTWARGLKKGAASGISGWRTRKR